MRYGMVSHEAGDWECSRIWHLKEVRQPRNLKSDCPNVIDLVSGQGIKAPEWTPFLFRSFLLRPATCSCRDTIMESMPA